LATVVVVGGRGFYGCYLVADLLEFTDAEIVTVGRTSPGETVASPRVRAEVCDIGDVQGLTEVVRGAAAVCHCAGPFQRLPLHPLKAALTAGVPYVDIAEDRAFRWRVLELEADARASGVPVLSGASVVPGWEALFAGMMRPAFDEMLAVRSFAAPDTRRHRGPAMFRTMLMGAGTWYEQPRDGRLARV
jgi:saccharopine dehydrogenase-like NADP-dependent oxidoreductase